MIRGRLGTVRQCSVVTVLVLFSGFNHSVANFWFKYHWDVRLTCMQCKLTLVGERSLIVQRSLGVLFVTEIVLSLCATVLKKFVSSMVLVLESTSSATVSAGCETIQDSTQNSDFRKLLLLLLG